MQEALFSYGTLQDAPVQLATFGRLLTGEKDSLRGFKTSLIKIEDEQVVATSGLTHHRIIRYSGNPDDVVEGMILLLTPAEIKQADEYEAADYQRVEVRLASGKNAWVYIDARENSSYF